MFERCLYFNVNSLARRVNKLWEGAYAEFQLSPAHAYMLRLVLAHPGISPKELSEQLKLEKSTITRFVDAMEQRRYLIRKKSGREQEIYPAAGAKRIEARLNQVGDELYATMIKILGKSNLVNLVNQLRETGELLR